MNHSTFFLICFPNVQQWTESFLLPGLHLKAPLANETLDTTNHSLRLCHVSVIHEKLLIPRGFFLFLYMYYLLFM